MYKVAINPVSGTLQLIHSSIPAEVKAINQDGVCTVNQIHIVTSAVFKEYTLPTNPVTSDWIKIFSNGSGGWMLKIPHGSEVVWGMRRLDFRSYIHSNMHRYDFIHLTFLGDVWYVENKSPTVGVS